MNTKPEPRDPEQFPDFFRKPAGGLDAFFASRAAAFAALGLIAGWGVMGGAASASLSEAEQCIAQSVDRRADAALSLLEQSVNINSGTLNHDGVRAVGDLFSRSFRDLGFETTWLDLRAETNRAGHLIATRAVESGPHILLIGHLDTVFPKDSDFQTFRIEEGRAIGPGVADMKGGDVAVIAALEALKDCDALDRASIEVVFTGDEEKTGKPISVSRSALIDAAKRADIALNFEGGERGAAVTGRRGSSSWVLTTSGQRRHSSGVFSENVGAGAGFEIARILNEFYEALSQEPNLTFNPGVMVAGTDVSYDREEGRGAASGKTNVVMQRAYAHGDLRFLTVDQKEAARETMRGIVAAHLPQTEAEIEFIDSYPAMTPNEANARLLSVLSGVSVDLGLEPLEENDPGRRGAADISFAAPYAGASLDGLGVYGSGAHGPEESLEIESLALAAKKAAILIYRLSSDDAPQF